MSEEKSIRIIEFSGKQSDWDGWSEKHLAKAEYKGYRKLMLCKKNEEGFDVVPTSQAIETIEAKPSTTDEEKKLLKLDKLNKQGFMDLVLSMNTTTARGKVAFRIVRNCKTSQYLDGNVKTAWDRLTQKYAPRTTTSLLNLKKKFENSVLKSSQYDPDEWISKLEGYVTDIETIDASSSISEKELMVHIINNLPKEYDVVLDGLENRLDATGATALTLEEIREKLCHRYERIKKESEVEEEYSNEKALLAFQQLFEDEKALIAFVQNFKGRCHKCGTYGHKGVNCPENKTSESNTQFRRGTCWFCEKQGHLIFDCKELQQMRAERTKKEVANVAFEDSDNESTDELAF